MVVNKNLIFKVFERNQEIVVQNNNAENNIK